MTTGGISFRPSPSAPDMPPAPVSASAGADGRAASPSLERADLDHHEILRMRIRNLIRDNGACFASVSAILGRSHSYIQQYLTRRSPKCLREHDRRKIARHFNIPEWDLLLPEERLSAAADNDLVLIPPWRREDSEVAGNGASHTPDRGDAMTYPFRRQWLQARLKAATDSLAVAAITGDGMAPTLCDGDLVLIEKGDRFGSDGIYLIEVAGEPRPRRMTAHPARDRIILSHDNPLYPGALECRPEELVIIGRIVWLGRALV